MRPACRPARRVARICLLASALLLLFSTAATAQRYVNTVNNRFATVSSGPQSSLIVDVAGGASREAISQAVTRRVRDDWKARARVAGPQVAALRKAGILRGRGAVPVSTLVAVRQAGRLVLPARTTRQVGGGTITFSYTGFSARTEDLLRQFVAVAYPRIQNLYGAPAWSGNVEVASLGDFDTGTGTDVQRLTFGTYDVTNNRILLPVYEFDESTLHAFLLLMIHAFHGPSFLEYDAWEFGFARAAASVIARDPSLVYQGGVPVFQDASANNIYSLLKFYDVLNQPSLGNPTFFPPSQLNVSLTSSFSIGKMFLARTAMSGAAWLKVYVENPSFFRQFNEAYYGQLNAGGTPGLAGNVPALRALAQNFAPNVEGQPFGAWYERQWVLDTSVSLGRKLYAFVLPSDPEDQAGQRQQSATIVLVYFNTKPNGDEDLLSGRAYATYYDVDNNQLFLNAESEQTVIAEGEGFLTTLRFAQGDNSDNTWLAMSFHIGNETARTYLPQGTTGDFQVVVLGAKTGRINVSQVVSGQTRTGSADIRGGVAGVNLGMANNDLGATTVTVTDASNNVLGTARYNAGDGRYIAILRLDGGTATVSRPFPAGMQLVSFPVRPLATDISAALGLPASSFLLSYYDPITRSYQTYGGGATTPPIEPGRGYWLKALPPSGGASQITANLTGVSPSPETDLTVSLAFGWNLIGTPFSQDVPVSQLQVQYLQNGSQTWESAVANNLVTPDPFGFNAQLGYQAIPLQGGALVPWQGYWVRVLVPSGITLIIPGTNNRGRAQGGGVSRAGDSRAARPEWAVRLRAKTSSATAPLPVATATFGVAQNASAGFDNRWDRESPPAIVPAVAIEFPHADWGNAGGRYTADYRAAGSTNAVWDVAVSSPTEGEVTLSWDGLGTVPRRTRLVLVDKTTGARTLLRGKSSYTFTATAGQSRAFQIRAESERSQALSISSIRMGATRGGGRSISYALSGPADVTIEVRTLGGKTLRKLSRGRAETPGLQTVHWDGRAENAAPLAVGAYLISITARGEDGATATQTRPVLMLN